MVCYGKYVLQHWSLSVLESLLSMPDVQKVCRGYRKSVQNKFLQQIGKTFFANILCYNKFANNNLNFVFFKLMLIS